MDEHNERFSNTVAANDRRKIVVVGPCASGKSSLVAALQKLGHEASACGQEHSSILSLWARSDPDIVIVLTADIAAVRARRGPYWPEWLHDVQMERLEQAIQAADLVLDTSPLNAEAVLAQVSLFLAQFRGESSVS